MTKRSAQHGTIRLERRYKAPPARVFAAWAEPQARAKWDVPGRWVIAEQTFDFREGGRELKRFGPKGDPHLVADTLYLDIVPPRRIVFSYSMTSRGTPISVSLTTIEISAEAKEHASAAHRADRVPRRPGQRRQPRGGAGVDARQDRRDAVIRGPRASRPHSASSARAPLEWRAPARRADAPLR